VSGVAELQVWGDSARRFSCKWGQNAKVGCICKGCGHFAKVGAKRKGGVESQRGGVKTQRHGVLSQRKTDGSR